MCRVLSLLLVLSLSAILMGADDAPKPNTLTPKEIADGWILLWDGVTTFGWKSEGQATIKDGMLQISGGDKAAIATTTHFGPCELAFEFMQSGAQQAKAQAQVAMGESLRLPAYNGWTRAVVKHAGDSIAGEFIGQQFSMKSSSGDPEHTESPAVIRFESPAQVLLSLRSIKLKPLSLKPLFNGKDLTGWRKFEGNAKQAKSLFSVTPEGWLHIKNGPGDLQTEGQYADFILQLECRTNGTRLNSGVFFRCRPGEYQQGYEAQIHNGWAEKPKEYIVEEYDPKNHELKDKKKVQSPALDYGSGAIYRRMPARQEVARDNEWFTLTVAAQGKHISTWVNGVQVVDWTDNRPLRDNARNGCRLEQGNISLQGHDPTTDLSFRNIRLAELAPAKENK
jgi:hypothetical protein